MQIKETAIQPVELLILTRTTQMSQRIFHFLFWYMKTFFSDTKIYVYVTFVVCYLPYFISVTVITTNGPNIALKRFTLFSLTLIHLNSIFKPSNLLLENETYSTRYHRHTAEHALACKSRITFVLGPDVLCHLLLTFIAFIDKTMSRLNLAAWGRKKSCFNLNWYSLVTSATICVEW